MTQEVETAVVELDLVSCQTCDLVFVASERRQTCPVCGGEGTGPYLEYVLDAAGLRLKNGSAVLPAGRPGEDVRPDTVAGPIAEAAPREAITSLIRQYVEEGSVSLSALTWAFLDGSAEEEDLRSAIEAAGAKPRVTRMTVQRLTAVRDLLRELAAAAAEPEVEVEAAPTPEEAPEPAAAVEAEAPPGQGAGDKFYAAMTAAEGDDPEPAP